MDAIPKVIVPKDKENIRVFVGKDAMSLQSVIMVRFMVSLTLSIGMPHIDLTLPMLEFGDPEDMSLLKDIGGKGALLLHYHARGRQVPFSCYDQLF